jgi:Mg-chelatase subunit ChlD
MSKAHYDDVERLPMTKIANIQEETEETLKKLDYIVVIDHSGSMGEPSHRMVGKSRLEEVAEEVLAIARQAERYDDDGITVIAFNNVVKVYDGVTAARVKDVFAEFPPKGSTNLAGAIRAVAEKTRTSKKEVLALIYTDGAPDSHAEVINAINSAAKEFGRPKIGFALIQVGQEKDAKAFLEKLDDDLKVDVVSTVTEEESEALSIGQLAWLARNA